MGPHTNAHSGIHITARDLARFGYLMLRRGRWGSRQIVPKWWMDLCTKPSQSLNRHYGYTWWVNNEKGTRWDSSVPPDAFSLSGYRCNRCYIVPSLDLVAVRVGSGPEQWDEKEFIRQVVECARG
jgi:CubicO group peptidase (beta-lactamase class C family)